MKYNISYNRSEGRYSYQKEFTLELPDNMHKNMINAYIKGATLKHAKRKDSKSILITNIKQIKE